MVLPPSSSSKNSSTSCSYLSSFVSGRSAFADRARSSFSSSVVAELVS
jgi:hypothetical protein